ncbi:jak pathway signal transduction adaptor molecule [Anaeramoeba flamelloides]|uniref:Jak pathway signal transduction adaptor molecule n=1 Tax=Anaeramoeba flamelloides TaxID=1746091 RepID=A0AAV7YBP3_9EUKA|nr:jak pathway signal transduction adaptor molecule [Anaeramoeba flamelloides]
MSSKKRKGSKAIKRKKKSQKSKKKQLKVKALFKYDSGQKGMLSFNELDTILVLEKNKSGWWFGEFNNTTGYFPSNYVKVISSKQMAKTPNKELQNIVKEIFDELQKKIDQETQKTQKNFRNTKEKNVSVTSEKLVRACEIRKTLSKELSSSNENLLEFLDDFVESSETSHPFIKHLVEKKSPLIKTLKKRQTRSTNKLATIVRKSSSLRSGETISQMKKTKKNLQSRFDQAQDLPQELPQDLPQDLPLDLPQDLPLDLPQNLPDLDDLEGIPELPEMDDLPEDLERQITLEGNPNDNDLLTGYDPPKEEYFYFEGEDDIPPPPPFRERELDKENKNTEIYLQGECGIPITLN